MFNWVDWLFRAPRSSSASKTLSAEDVQRIVSGELAKVRLEASTSKERESRRLRKFAALSIVIFLLCLTGGVAAAYYTIVGFSAPEMTQSHGLITVTLAGKEQESGFGAYVTAHYSQDGQGNIQVYFPDSAIGQKWTLVLYDDAVLQDPSLPASTVRCGHGLGSISAITSDCQLYQGLVERAPSRSSPDLTVTQYVVDSCQLDDKDAENIEITALGIQITGKATITTASTWASVTQSTPALDQEPRNIFKLTDLYTGLEQYADYYAVPLSSDCRTISIPEGYKVAETEPNPAIVNGNFVGWQEPLLDDPLTGTVAFRLDDAEALQNAGIIVAGVLLAIAGGFIPVIIQTYFITGIRAKKVCPTTS